jgi:hypothetical protein
MQRKRTPTGIRARHSKTCDSAQRRECSCSPSWEAWVFLPRDKKKVRKTFPTQAAAKAWRADAQVALRKGMLRAPSNVTLREAAESWLQGAKAGLIRTGSGDPYKPSVVRGYGAALRQRILPLLGARRLSEIKRVDLQDLADELLSEGLSASTIRNVIMPVRSIYRRAVSRGDITANPTAGLELPSVALETGSPPQKRRGSCSKHSTPTTERYGLLRSTPACGAESCRRFAGKTSTSKEV